MHFIRKVIFATVVAIMSIMAPSLSANASELELSEEQIQFIVQHHQIAAELGYEAGIPWEAVMAQGIVESGAGTSKMAVSKNNLFGLGAYDSNPNPITFDTYEDCWRFYYNNIHSLDCYRINGALNYPDDPYGYVQAIKAAGYASADNYVSTISCYIRAVEDYSDSQGWESSAEIIARKHAEEERRLAVAAMKEKRMEEDFRATLEQEQKEEIQSEETVTNGRPGTILERYIREKQPLITESHEEQLLIGQAKGLDGLEFPRPAVEPLIPLTRRRRLVL